MTEQLIREIAAEKDRVKDRVEDANRFGRVESDHAVLRTIVDAAVKRFDEAMERAVSAEDLKELKREWERALHEAIVNIREHFNAANDQQAASILGQVQTMLATERLAAAEDAKNLRRQIFLALFTWGLGIIGALFLFWLAGRTG